MMLRNTLGSLSAAFDAAGRPAFVTHDARNGLTLWLKPLGLLAVTACMAVVLNAAHAQENNPEESDITYENLDPPGGGTENKPEDSDIIYEDFPNDLPEDEGGNNPLPLGEQPPRAVPEPAMLALLVAGAASALILSRRRSRGA